VPSTYRDAVQGFIIILAVAYAATTFRARRRGSALETSAGAQAEPKEPDAAAASARPAPIPSTQRADNETKGGS
jgi:ribose transport system permease protein